MERTTEAQLASMAAHLSKITGRELWCEQESGVWSLRHRTEGTNTGETVLLSATSAGSLWDQMRAALRIHEAIR